MRMTRHRTLRAIALVALTGAGITLQCPGTALALKTRPQLPFSPFGSFTGATGIAVDQANGNVLVADSAADEVRVFGATGGSPAGGAAGSLTGAQTPAGAFRWGADDSEGHEIYVHPAGVAVDNACAQHGLSGAACTAFDPSNGAIYVTDVFHDVVDKFVVNAAHEYEYVCQFTGFGFAGTACLKNEPTVQATPSEGAFEEPDGVAVDREGNVYVADGGFDEGIVDEFNAAGEDVRRMKSKEIRRLQDIAVDGKGDIYIHAYGNYRKRGEEGYPSFSEIELVRSGFTGGIEGETNPHFHTYMGPVGVGPTGLAFDLASARLFIGYAALQENTLEARQVEEYNEAGEYQTSFGLSGRGIAVNEASDDVYVANQGSISVFGPVVDTPFPVTGSASNVSTAGATVEGSVNPESSTLAAECEVQYGPTEAFGSSVPCEPANVGTGETAVPVTAHLTGLQPGLTYDYRVVARNEEGPAPGGVGSFTTKPAAPIVVGEAASSVTPGSAVLGATINTLNIGISYHFVYGLTSKYGTSIPLSDVSLAASREATPSVSLEGLLPDTTYHFAVIATSAGGTTVGPDATFSTAAPTPPVVGAVAVGGVTRKAWCCRAVSIRRAWRRCTSSTSGATRTTARGSSGKRAAVWGRRACR